MLSVTAYLKPVNLPLRGEYIHGVRRNIYVLLVAKEYEDLVRKSLGRPSHPPQKAGNLAGQGHWVKGFRNDALGTEGIKSLSID